MAVLTIAVAVAFLTSTVILVTALSAQTTAIAADFDSPGVVERVSDGEREQATVYLPTTRAEVDGQPRVFVGADDTAAATIRDRTGVQLPGPPAEGASLGTATDRHEITVGEGAEARVVSVAPGQNGRTVLPHDWYVTNGDTVEELGAAGGYVIRESETGENTGGTPLVGALPFFVTATGGLRELLLATAVGVGVLTGGIVFSVTRMTVRDRQRTIRVVRATGGTGRSVLVVLMARVGLVVGVGIALGYAFGVIGTNAVVNLAVYAGLPTSLTTTVTRTAAATLLSGYGVVFAIGLLAGAVATLPTVRAPPARVGHDDGGTTVPFLGAPEILEWRVLWPSTSALTVFVAAVFVLAAVMGSLGPLVSSSGQTITEPGAVHAVSSSVPEAYAGVFEADGVAASPEILGFTVLRGEATLVRGVQYVRFMSVSDADLVAGHQPDGRHEAVIGADLADALDVDVGDNLTVGGSTTPAVTSVVIVGEYDAPGYHDDQLLVSLPTARHLTEQAPGTVHFVRLSETVPTDDSVRVVNVDAPGQVGAGSPVSITATIVNPGDTTETVEVPARFGDEETTLSATVPASGTTTVNWTPQAGATGTQEVTVGDVSRTVEVRSPDTVSVSGLPERVPPNQTVSLRVRDLNGTPVNATIEYEGREVRTGSDGIARVSFAESGEQTLTVRHDTARTRVNVTVTPDAPRALNYRWDAPSSATPLTQLTPALVVDNPWNETVTETVTLTGPGTTRTVTVEVEPGETRRIPLDLGRLSPGSYDLEASTDGEQVAGGAFEVRGDERLASALAARSDTSGGGTGIGQAIATVFGNVQVVLGVVLAFAAAMSVAGTAAAFSYDVRANRHTIGVYRATGATQWRVLRLLVGDATRIGVVAALFALVLGALGVGALAELGVFRLFGVSVTPQFTLGLLALTALGCLCLTIAGTILAAVPTLRASPRELLDGGASE